MKTIEYLLEIAGTQHGAIANFQLADLGLAHSSYKDCLRSPVFTKHFRGTYTITGSKNTWHQQAAIAVLANGRGALLSHTSALKNLDLLEKDFNDINVLRGRFDRDLQKFHIVTNRDIRNEKDFYIHRSVSIKKKPKLHVVNGIAQVSVERAIIESASIMGNTRLDNVLFAALRSQITTTALLSKELENTRTAPGRSKMIIAEVLKHYSKENSQQAKLESPLEKRFYDLFVDTLGLELQTQYPIKIAGQNYRADFAIPNEKIIIEVDGHEFHRTRAQLDSDRRRQNAISSEGWKFLRITAKFTNQEVLQSLQALRSNDSYTPA